jgi:hypothetical protein
VGVRGRLPSSPYALSEDEQGMQSTSSLEGGLEREGACHRCEIKGDVEINLCSTFPRPRYDLLSLRVSASPVQRDALSKPASKEKKGEGKQRSFSLTSVNDEHPLSSFLPTMGTKDKDTKVRTHYAAHSIRAKAASSTPLNRSPAPVPESSATSPSIPTATSSGGKSGKGKGRAIPPLVGTSKLVYKGLVESPNVIRWSVVLRSLALRPSSSLSDCFPSPSGTRPATLPNHLQTTLLHTNCSLLDGCAQHHVAKSRASKSTRKASSKRSMIHLSEEELLNEGPSLSTTPKLDGRPKILDHLVLGLNGVTKELSSLPYSSSTNEAPDTVAYVFVCHPDISPPSLVAHLPALCAVYNGKLIARGRSKDLGLRLVSLGKGAEYVLAQALGLRRVGVLAFKVRIGHASVAKKLASPGSRFLSCPLCVSSSLPFRHHNTSRSSTYSKPIRNPSSSLILFPVRQPPQL